jgi:hypothetical protein
MLTAGSQPQRFRRRGGELCHPEAAFRPKDLSEESRQRIDHPEATFFGRGMFLGLKLNPLVSSAHPSARILAQGSAVDFRFRVVAPGWTA